jgi:EKC/KEOPS complex subunit CGI121/TPRKB
MESYPLVSQNAIVHIALFSNLINAIELRSRLVAASLLTIEQGGDIERSKLDFAFIDANMVCTSLLSCRIATDGSGPQIISRLHLLTAVNQALIAHAAKKLKTTTIHSEIILELEPGTNVRSQNKFSMIHS